MNDWLDYKGSGSSRAYAANDFIAHSSRSEKTEALMKQRDAYDRLSKALVAKANKLLEELESADKSVADISATIRDNTRKDKNYNTNGLLQRKKTYLIRRATINAELDKTIKEVEEIRNKMWKEIGYTGFEVLTGGDPDFSIDLELRRINHRRNLLLKSKYDLVV